MKLMVLFCSGLLLSLSVPSQVDAAETQIPGNEKIMSPEGNTQPELREPACEQYEEGLCSRQYEPVCGTDGKTYATECVLCHSNSLEKKHVKVAHNGEC